MFIDKIKLHSFRTVYNILYDWDNDIIADDLWWNNIIFKIVIRKKNEFYVFIGF